MLGKTKVCIEELIYSAYCSQKGDVDAKWLDRDGRIERRGRCRLPPDIWHVGPSRQSLTDRCQALSEKPRGRQGEGGKGRGIATSVDLV